MARAMLLRVRRLEVAAATTKTQVASVPTVDHSLMTRLALHPDLFREVATIAGAAPLGVDMSRVGRSRCRRGRRGRDGYVPLKWGSLQGATAQTDAPSPCASGCFSTSGSSLGRHDSDSQPDSRTQSKSRCDQFAPAPPRLV